MYLEHQLNPSSEGTFTFMRPTRDEPTPVEVQTDFSNAELSGIFNLTREEGYWDVFEAMVSEVGSLGSGFARELQVDTHASIPTAFGLKEKKTAVLRMNTMRVLLGMMPMDNPAFVTGVFVGQDPVMAAEVVEGLRTELDTLLTQNGWVDDEVMQKLPSVGLIDYLARLKEYYKAD